MLIEFVLVAPFLVLLCLGIFEFGNAYRQIGAIERAAQQGARTTASMANHRYADLEALRAIDTATRGLAGLTIERVIIYNATDEDGAVPDACLTESVPDTCNYYSGSQVQSTSPGGFSGGTSSAPACAPSAWDSAWCPVDRPRQQDSLVRIGVHLTLTYEPVTHLLPTEFTLTRTAIYQIDPCQQGQTEC